MQVSHVARAELAENVRATAFSICVREKKSVCGNVQMT